MEQITYGEANTTSLFKKFFVFYENRIHYRVHKGPQLGCIISHMKSFHTYLFKIHLNATLQITLRFFRLLFSIMFSSQNLYALLVFTICFTCHAYLVHIDFITQTISCLFKSINNKASHWVNIIFTSLLLFLSFQV
jgi:hypothetical protein